MSSYPDGAIHANTDGSVVHAIRNRGYGSVIKDPDVEEPILLSGLCGTYCTNYDHGRHSDNSGIHISSSRNKKYKAIIT